MSSIAKIRNNHWFKTLLLVIISGCCFYTSYALAGTTDVTGLVSNVTQASSTLAKLISSVSYLAGLGFAMGSIMKFKQHKDNPTQIPIGTPIALLIVAASLMFLPSVFRIAGNTVFGSDAQSGGFSGITSIS